MYSSIHLDKVPLVLLTTESRSFTFHWLHWSTNHSRHWLADSNGIFTFYFIILLIILLLLKATHCPRTNHSGTFSHHVLLLSNYSGCWMVSSHLHLHLLSSLLCCLQTRSHPNRPEHRSQRTSRRILSTPFNSHHPTMGPAHLLKCSPSRSLHPLFLTCSSR